MKDRKSSFKAIHPISRNLGKTLLSKGDAQFWFETLRMFGAEEYGGASFGEVLVTCAQIKAGDYDSWHDGWNSIADRVAAAGDAQLAKGHEISARDSYLRASNYYRCAEFFLHANAEDRVIGAYHRSVACYKAAAKLFDPPIEPVEIPYEHTILPGYLHWVDTSKQLRPLLIVHTGFDGSAEENHWLGGVRAAVERGYNVLSFDGPGQFGPIHREGLTFRPDWENVVTPVVDFALTQRGVDPNRIALMGISMGGELAPRAAAFEPRLAALIANDGLYDYAAPYFAAAPEILRPALLAAVKAGPSTVVDLTIKQAMKISPTVRWAMIYGMYSFGAASPSAYVHAALDYTLADGVAERIRCPTLVCDAEGDLFFKGQPQQLFDHLTCKKTLLTFTDQEGAGAHCQFGALRFAFARIFDWLDETLEL
ncbi:S9 family peptidase [Beijerinckia sp. L45]|uniref:alpha/beta hydrolase family protein n=1 Tax=Beijerinckia sp. L45 TaxID=1641855 RepID=UPI001FEE8FD8|nr:alpha/beta hydrolase [Beijerinckia sp. L45]